MSRNKKNRLQVKGQPSGGSRIPGPPPAPPIDQIAEQGPFAPSAGVNMVAEVKAVSPLLLTVDQVCSLLAVSRWTLQRLEKSGGLPGRVKLGGQVRYHREVIEEWLRGKVE